MDLIKKVNELSEKVGVLAVDTYKNVSKKSSDLVQETKLKLAISDKKEEIENTYRDMGETLYRLAKQGEKLEGFEEDIKLVSALEEEIKDYEKEILNLKNEVKCDNCNENIDKDSKHCPSCGYENEKVKTKTATKTVKKEEKTNEPKMVKVEIKKPKVEKTKVTPLKTEEAKVATKKVEKPKAKKVEVKEVKPKATAKKAEVKEAKPKATAKKTPKAKK